MKRVISVVLVLALACSLGVSAFADGTPNIDDNPAGQSTSVSEGQVMDTNAGTVTDNSGTVETNNGSVEENNGTVETNNGTVAVNNGTVAVNNETVSCNYGTMEENYGTVTNKTNLDEIGQPAGSVNMDNNYGTVIDVTPEGTTTYFGVVFEETDSSGGAVRIGSGVEIEYALQYYEVEEGKDLTISANVTMGLTWLMSAPGQLIIKIDGIKVDAGNYTVTVKSDGSVSVVLSAEFIKTLSAGSHSFTIMSGAASFDTKILV